MHLADTNNFTYVRNCQDVTGGRLSQMWKCDRVTVWLCDCVTVWLCDCVTVWLCDCMFVWLYDHITVWLNSCVTVWWYDCVTVWLYDCVTDIYVMCCRVRMHTLVQPGGRLSPQQGLLHSLQMREQREGSHNKARLAVSRTLSNSTAPWWTKRTT